MDRATGFALMLALNKTEAAKALGVSVDFFNDHVAREVRCVRRGRRRLYPVDELKRWLDAEAEVARYPQPDDDDGHVAGGYPDINTVLVRRRA